MTNRDKFQAKLTKLFDGVRDAFLKHEKDYFRNWADRQLEAFLTHWKNPPEPKPRQYGERESDAGKPGPLVARWQPSSNDVPHGYLWWSYGEYDLSVHCGKRFDDPEFRKRCKLDSEVRKLIDKYRYSTKAREKEIAIQQAAIAEGLYTADHRKAEDEATAYVRQAELNFVAKQSQKLASAVGSREVTALEGTLSLERGVVTGSLTVTCGDDKFTAIMEIKTNYRYGANAANRKLTVYAQYPTRFKNVTLGGQTFKSKSEKWLSENFSSKVALPS